MVQSPRSCRAAFLAALVFVTRPAAAANTTRGLPELASGPFVFGVGQCPTPGEVEAVKRRVLIEQLGARTAAALGITDEEGFNPQRRRPGVARGGKPKEGQ